MLRARHEPRMHPEYARRLFAWIESKGGVIGIGGGWRATGSQPDKPGFAEEGKSFHQDQRFASGFVGYAAVDLVAREPGKVHRAPRWAESTDAPLYGLHTFITNEPWHMQPIEIRGWQGWVNAGRPDPRSGFTLPGAPQPPEIVQPKGPRMHAIPAVELQDTRKLPSRISAGQQVKVATAANRPDWAKSAIVNVTVTEPLGPGYVTLWSTNWVKHPGTSNVNYNMAGVTVANLAVVPLAADGSFVFAPMVNACHVKIDQQGWAE
jgi:hypothetical protein